MIAVGSNINPGPVFSAGSAPTIEAAQSTLPYMASTIRGWFKPLTIGILSTVIAEAGDDQGEAKNTIRELLTSGVIQAGSPEKLSVQPEGERSWENATLHVLPQLDVPTGTKLQINGTLFEVMVRQDWSANGYMRYELIQSYTP